MRIVLDKVDHLGSEFIDSLEIGIKFNSRERFRRACELLRDLIFVIFVDMEISERVNEFSGFTAEYLCDDRSQKRIACDIERNSQKHIGTALIELHTDLAVFNIDL